MPIEKERRDLSTPEKIQYLQNRAQQSSFAASSHETLRPFRIFWH